MKATIDGRLFDTDCATLVDVALVPYEDSSPDVLKLYAQGPDKRFVVWSSEDDGAYIEPLTPELTAWLSAAGVEWRAAQGA